MYGDDKNIRDLLHIEDHCKAIDAVLQRGATGGTYNIGSGNEWANIDIIRLVCNRLDEIRPGNISKSELIEFIKDRPGHDKRYAIDASKIIDELGFLEQADHIRCELPATGCIASGQRELQSLMKLRIDHYIAAR